MAKPIGDEVITTDDFYGEGYDNLPLMQGGMLKVDPTATAVGAEKLLKPNDDVPDPNVPEVKPLVFTKDLPATLTVSAGDVLELSTAVEGGVEPYTVVWSKGGQVQANKTDLTWTVAPSSGGGAASGHAGIYLVKVTDAEGTTITSQSCNVIVKVKTVTGKGNITGKKAGDTLADTDLFNYSSATSTALAASKADVTNVTGTDVTWNNSTKTLKIADTLTNPGADITLSFTVGTGVSKSGTIVLKAVAAATP